MKRILRGTVFLALTAVFGACSSESGPTQDGTPDHIVAEPSVVFIARGDSQSVKLRLVDQQGTSLKQPISISGFGTGINVRADSSVRPIYETSDSLVFNPNSTELQVWVSTNALASSNFTVAAGGKTLDIPVVVTPGKSEPFQFSTLAPALGDVVTVNASTDLVFLPSSQMIFGLDTLTPVSVAADGSSLTFNAAPGLLGPAVITDVTLSYNTNVKFPVTASDTMNSPPLDEPFVYSDKTTDIGQVITITPPAGVLFSPGATGTKASFDSSGQSGPLPRFTVAPDGSSMTLEAGPNTAGAGVFTKMYNPANPTFTFTLKSTDTLRSARVDTFPVTTDKTTAAANEAVSITTGGSLFKFPPSIKLTAGGNPVYVVSVAGDSSGAVVLPQPGTAAGQFAETGGLVSGFPLSLPTNKAVTVASGTLTGTDAFVTAPVVAVPAVGAKTAFWDGAPYGFDASGDFGGGARLYKITVAAGQKINFALPIISDGADLGVYFYDAAFAPQGFAVDGKGGGTGNAEAGDITFATAGVYYIAVVYFQYAASPTPAAHYVLQLTGK